MNPDQTYALLISLGCMAVTILVVAAIVWVKDRRSR